MDAVANQVEELTKVVNTKMEKEKEIVEEEAPRSLEIIRKSITPEAVKKAKYKGDVETMRKIVTYLHSQPDYTSARYLVILC